jgi:hypothetical protein
LSAVEFPDGLIYDHVPLVTNTFVGFVENGLNEFLRKPGDADEGRFDRRQLSPSRVIHSRFGNDLEGGSGNIPLFARR